MPEHRYQGFIFVYSRRGRTVATAALKAAGVTPLSVRPGVSKDRSYYYYVPTTQVEDEGYGSHSAAHINTNLTAAEIDVVLLAIALAHREGETGLEPYLHG